MDHRIGRVAAVLTAVFWSLSCGGSKGTPGPAAPLVPQTTSSGEDKPASPAGGVSFPAASQPATVAASDEGSRGVSLVQCEIRGAPVMPKDAVLWDAAQGGNAIASFAGQPIGVAAFEVPARPGGRVKIRTAGGIQVEGWVAASELPVFAADQVAVVAGHVWVSRGQPFVLISASAGAPAQLALEASVAGQLVQTIRLTAPCSAVTLDRRERPGWDVPGSGRGYVPRREQLDLYGEPGGASVFTARPRAPETSMLMFSTETRAGFVHVLFHDELVIDAWARESDLIALKPGERMDQLALPTRTPGAARLMLSGTPTLARAAKDVQIRLTPENSSKPLGVVAPDTELYVVDTVLGWSSVLPRALNLLPPRGRSFWVPASEISTTR